MESPEVLVPLLSGITNAWIWTTDRRLGLFSGSTVVAGATAAAGAVPGGHAEGRGDVVDMLAEDHGAEDDPSHEDAMLQVSWQLLLVSSSSVRQAARLLCLQHPGRRRDCACCVHAMR